MNYNVSCIYIIENQINHKVYIGQTQNFRIRRNSHLSNLTKGTHFNSYLQNSWNKYGAENFTISILEKCNVEFLDKREIFWILKYNSIQEGYNLKEGGKRGGGYKLSEEAKQKMRENHADISGKNNPMYGISLMDILDKNAIESWKNKISEANKGDKNKFYGKQHSNEVKQKISQSKKQYYSAHTGTMLGRKHTVETIEKIKLKMKPKFGADNLNSKAIICLNTMEKFQCIQDASKKYDIARTSISNCCAHKILYAGKINGIPLLWMYDCDFIKNGFDFNIEGRIAHILNSKIGENNPSAKKVICITTNIVFETVTKASAFYAIDKSSIVKCCKGKIKYSGVDKITNKKLIWMYYQDYITLCQTSNEVA